MRLVDEFKVLQGALQRNYAVGAFNANNMELVQAISQAAEVKLSPVIIQVSPGAIKYAGMEYAAGLVRIAADKCTVPIVLHLDHGKDLETNYQCARAGFTGLMFDGSELGIDKYKEKTGQKKVSPQKLIELVQSEESLELNVAATKEVVRMGHEFGIHVEAEIGHIPRIEHLLVEEIYQRIRGIPAKVGVQEIRKHCGAYVEALMAIPDQVEYFVKETGCDALAAAIGSIHGMAEDMWPIRIDRLQEIQQRTGLPIVSHGSSGVLRSKALVDTYEMELLPGEGTLEDAVKLGLAKVNVATALSVTFLDEVDNERRENPDERDLRKPFIPARKAVQSLVEEYIDLLGSAGKA